MRAPLYAVESLEPRRLLNAGGSAGDTVANVTIANWVMTDANSLAAGSAGVAPSGSANPPGTSPYQVREAYGINNIMFGSTVGDGTGETIAVIGAYNDPTAANDLHMFDRQLGLPDPPSFTQVNQTGGSVLPGTDPAGKGNDWEMEESRDIEWARAVAPGASIILVEANSPSNSDLLTAAVGWARGAPGVSVVLMDFGSAELSGETAYDGLFTTPVGHGGVTFVAPSGDNRAGAYPAFSPNVLSVGGTSGTMSSSGALSGEYGVGVGGTSVYEAQPRYQQGVVPQSATARAIPDVASYADSNPGGCVCDSSDFGASTPWTAMGGTGLAAACWAGLVAIADQGRAINGAASLDGATQTLPRLYSLPASNFHDITTGSDLSQTGPGYDLTTGLGSPVANTLVPYLAASAPCVSSVAPSTLQTAAPTHIDFNFSQPMDPTSFALPSGLDAFTGPGNVDLSASVTGYAWLNNNTTVEVDFTAPAAAGPYAMTIGPQVRSAFGADMDQNQNGVSGESAADQFTGTVYYDPSPTQVAFSGPAAGTTTVPAPLTTFDVHFSAPYDPTTVSTSNLSISEGFVSGAAAIDSTTVEYSLGDVNGWTVTVSIPQGALKDANGNPIFAFTATYQLVAPTPTVGDWTTMKGNPGHTGYVAATFNPSYHPLLWSTTLQNYALTGMSLGANGLYVAADPYNGDGNLPNLFALNPSTGALNWQVLLGRFSYSPAPRMPTGTSTCRPPTHT